MTAHIAPILEHNLKFKSQFEKYFEEFHDNFEPDKNNLFS